MSAMSWLGDDLDEDEQSLVYSVLDSFSQYRQTSHQITHARRQYIHSLPRHHQASLADVGVLQGINQVDDAIDANADLAEAIALAAATSLGIAGQPWLGKAQPHDIEKCKSTIKQLFRDWSAHGEAERNACYGPVLGALQGVQGKILVPGAGLGRLVFEICRLGFEVEGNEISYHQLFASSFVLNMTTGAEQWPIYPFAHAFSNNLSRANQLRRVSIPDVWPGGSSTTTTMTMTTGDFAALYSAPEYRQTFAAVVTVFFVDTAANVLHYIETVKHCLQRGGIWINLGPLLWHNSRGVVELSHDELIALLQKDFRVEQRLGAETGYIQDDTSMLQYMYRPSFWTAHIL